MPGKEQIGDALQRRQPCQGKYYYPQQKQADLLRRARIVVPPPSPQCDKIGCCEENKAQHCEWVPAPPDIPGRISLHIVHVHDFFFHLPSVIESEELLPRGFVLW